MIGVFFKGDENYCLARQIVRRPCRCGRGFNGIKETCSIEPQQGCLPIELQRGAWDLVLNDPSADNPSLLCGVRGRSRGQNLLNLSI